MPKCRFTAAIIAMSLLLAAAVTLAAPAAPAPTRVASGEFEVRLVPQPPDSSAAGPFSRLWLDKSYHGDLEAAGHGQMLAYLAHTEGSRGYVALERVEGTLGGRHGSFVLQHTGLMNKGAVVTLGGCVVPDSGTGDLTGLAGDFTIVMDGGRHAYELHYTLP